MLPPADRFRWRHLGPRPHEVEEMLALLGADSVDALVDLAVPRGIRTERELELPRALSEREALQALAERASENEVWRSYLGMGYHDTVTPPVILRNVLENPGWYTAYTPYQAEISQGRLEALLIFQTMVQDLCGLEIANASLLDEATAAAEAMAMAHRITRGKVSDTFFVSEHCHPQTIAVVKTRAKPLGIEVVVGDHESFDFSRKIFGALLQYPATDGRVFDYSAFCAKAHDNGALVAMATDLLALTLLTSPGELGADIAIGNSQRFGVPLGYGGPHAAFMATRTDYRRQMPGRVIGVSMDADGNPALRMALQTREQHIRRQKATSNICTAQVLLAVVAGLYAVWHGQQGLRNIGGRVHGLANLLASGLSQAGHRVHDGPWFDTVRVSVADREAVIRGSSDKQINLRSFEDGSFGIALDETVSAEDLADLLEIFGAPTDGLSSESALPKELLRDSAFCTHPTFGAYYSETEMLRYLHRLETRDLTLNTSMIPLGSCTMKLNATTEMIPVTWKGFGGLHPFAPLAQTKGYQRLFGELESWLAEITGFAAVSLQPNAGSQGEYAGLLCIRAFHQANGHHRDVCLIPTSAHGTNPASAVMAGMKVVAVRCDDQGNIDVADLRAKAETYQGDLAALMVTYPSTHGVFEESIREICDVVHEHGGQVYMDGANMNAMVGLVRPAEIGADVLHLNLHKTFCIPHGGGGPGMGPIGVKAHLQPFLPGHPVVPSVGAGDVVSAAPWGSPSILPISWAYIAMLGPEGLKAASQVAILNANYVAKRLEGHYDVLYTGADGLVAHECILDLRGFKATSGVIVDDVAKRLMDYGFHAPTMSFPVAGTLMVEPTESEGKAELDRFCEAMIAIRGEIDAIHTGESDPEDNALKHAPHTAASVISDAWPHAYSREQAAYPAPWLRDHKYWPAVRRIDNAWGDRNLMCSCIVEWPPSDG